MGMYWGRIVNNLIDIDTASSAGYKNILLPVDLISNLDEKAFILQKEHLHQKDITVDVFSSPLPPDVRVTEMGFNLYVWTEYLKKAIDRISKLGCRRIAWNNGRARVLPWEGDRAGVKEQVLQFIYMLCEIAGEYDITIMIEPLCSERTNFLNSMGEIKEFISKVGQKNISSMISLRELKEIEFPLDQIGQYMDLIDHVHLENPLQSKTKRIAPQPKDNVNLYVPLLKALKKANYSGMVCLPEDADSASLNYCKDLLGKVS